LAASTRRIMNRLMQLYQMLTESGKPDHEEHGPGHDPVIERLNQRQPVVVGRPGDNPAALSAMTAPYAEAGAPGTSTPRLAATMVFHRRPGRHRPVAQPPTAVRGAQAGASGPHPAA
jgi:hypothetical protein